MEEVSGAFTCPFCQNVNLLQLLLQSLLWLLLCCFLQQESHQFLYFLVEWPNRHFCPGLLVANFFLQIGKFLIIWSFFPHSKQVLTPAPVFSLQKRTAAATLSKTIGRSMHSQLKINPRYPTLMISLMCLRTGCCSQKWTLSEDTTMYTLRKVMNGKSSSSHQKASSSLPSCISAYAFHQEHLCA